jgi:hypothetical protein
MNITRDKQGQPMIEWEMADGGWKRAWIQDRSGSDKDWAGTGKYLNVARVAGPGIGPGGNATDFPIFLRPPRRTDPRGIRPVSLRHHRLPTKANGLSLSLPPILLSLTPQHYGWSGGTFHLANDPINPRPAPPQK